MVSEKRKAPEVGDDRPVKSQAARGYSTRRPTLGSMSLAHRKGNGTRVTRRTPEREVARLSGFPELPERGWRRVLALWGFVSTPPFFRAFHDADWHMDRSQEG